VLNIPADDFLLVGTIGLPFGVRGQVKLHAITSRPEHLRRLKTLYLGDDRLPIAVRGLTQQKPGILVLTLAGIDSRNAAENLRNVDVYIHPHDAAPLEEDEYYLHDLPGMQVETTSGELLGTVKEVLETGANEVLVVSRPEGGEVLIPMIRDVVKRLDVEQKQIVIEPMEGLLS
jgi:16S rRNA processing protein RimM